MIALDTETTGLDLHHGCRPFYVSTCSDTGTIQSWEWDVDPETREPQIPPADLRDLQDLVNTSYRGFVFHNAKFDIRALTRIGISFPENAWDYVQDTVIASHVLASAESHKLKDLALQYLGISDDDQQDLRKAVNDARRYGRKHGWRIAAPEDPHFPALRRAPKLGWSVMDMWLPRAVASAEGYPPDHPWWTVCSRYADTDAERTMGLWWVFRDALEEEGLWDLYETRRRLLGITYGMEERGITVSIPRLEAAKEDFSQRADRAARVCYRLCPNFDNLQSSQQIQGVLYHDLRLKPVKHTKSGQGWATDADTLRALQLQVPTRSKAHHFLVNLLRSRQCAKMVDYLEAYQAFGVPHVTEDRGYGASNPYDWLTLYPSFNVTGTATTRLSSHDPNAQNISTKEDFNLRQAFGPLPGREWWSIDYTNIELRIFAYCSGDKNLIKAFESGESVHLVIAEALHPREFSRLGPKAFKDTDAYKWTKNGNFSLIYGASPAKADATYRVPGAYDQIRKRFPLIDNFIASKFEEGYRLGYVTTLGGYRLQVPRREPHKAANSYVQGSAGWAMILAMIRVRDYLQTLPDHHLIMNIHDELDFDFPRGTSLGKVRKIKWLMERSGQDLGLPTPVDVERSRTSWAEGVSIAV